MPSIRIAHISILCMCWSPFALSQLATVNNCEGSVECLRQHIAELRRDTNQRIAALESSIYDQSESRSTLAATANTTGQAHSTTVSFNAEDRLSILGDARLRYENTSAHNGLSERNRGVIRVRLGAIYSVNDRFSLGARLATGDPDDPNSTDVSMGNFIDDLEVSLDRAYASFRTENLLATGGKIANPFTSTDLVWDSDVNPYGLAGQYTLHDGDTYTSRITAIHALIDEQIVADDSTMSGAQVSFELRPDNNWTLALDAAYFDYSIGSLISADQGDTRGNIITADGSEYVSDFDLLDTIVRIEYSGLGDDWPVAIAGDYVKNLDAGLPEDSGYALDFFLGKNSKIGDWRFRYGFAVAETDAVFAAFSHDNTTYATNYRQHTVAVDYVPFDNTSLNLTGYFYQRDKFDPILEPDGDDFVSRIRLNLSFDF